VLSFRSPSDTTIQRFLASAGESRLTYSEVGATAGIIPPLYTSDHNRVKLGTGAEVWDRAVLALRTWKMFNIPWIQLCRQATPIAVGENVAVVARYLNCYWLNACRIVYAVDEPAGPLRRFGFAYGTLEDHAESGEERFLLEWDGDSNEVWYDLLAFSRPNQFLARVGYPFARRLQKRFVAESKLAMVRAVSESER
jgi:uncharacterized protein (UPF0548 family)